MNEKFDLNNSTKTPKELIEFMLEIQTGLSKVSDANLDDEIINKKLEELGASDRVKCIFKRFVNVEKASRK